MRTPVLRPLVLAVALCAGLAAAGPLAGCTGSAGVVAASPQEAYERGAADMAARRYDRAIEHFRAALDFGRTHEWADEAQLGLARAYQASGQHLLAVTEFTRFIDFYPTDERNERAAYERIESYVALSPPYELDQTDTQQAITYIRLFQTRYPDSPHQAGLAETLTGLLEKLARKEYEAARLYERRELYEAAALTFQNVVEGFPASAYVDDAMLGQVRAYTLFAEASIRARQAERFQLALDVYDRLVQLFPQSDVMAEAQSWYDRAYRGHRAAAPAEVPAPAAAQN